MMKNKISTLLILILIVSSLRIAGQDKSKLLTEVNGKKSHLSFIIKRGNFFVPVKELSSLLSANHYFNKEALKLEVKFSNYTLKFTAKNQFVILTRKTDNTQNIYQLPISTLLIKDEIYVPLNYCIDYFSVCYGRKIVFDDRTQIVSVTKEPYSEEIFFLTSLKQSGDDKEIKETVKIDSKYDIYGIEVEEKSNGTLIRLKSSKKINVPRYSINENILYVFFPGITITPDLAKQFKAAGLVKQFRRVALSQKNFQLEFSLSEGYSGSQAFKDVESNDILITIQNTLFNDQLSDSTDVKSKWEFDVVVIDAGHGGKDPGAIGMTGVREKDVNLAVALKLGKLIERKFESVKVIYTRKTDEFIELYKRGKIANEAGGKLFISIHCNSTVQKDISHRGFEVYLLRPGRTKEAIQIAEFENSVIKYEDNPNRYQQLTDENFILVSMAHSQYMRYSEKFSDVLNQDWKRNVGIPSLGIKQAGFYVLVGASMPSVLIETGFLSNRKDEAYLNSSDGQNEIAESIFNSIRKFKQYYDETIKVESSD